MSPAPDANPPCERMNGPRCAAWAETILRYWLGLRRRGALDMSATLDVLGVMSDPRQAVQPLLDALNARAPALLGAEVRVRYLACFADRAAADAWCARPECRVLVDAGAVEPMLWRMGEDAPRHATGEHESRAWQPANAAVVLMHDVLQRLPQRLLAVHYGKLLEADVAGILKPQTGSEELWHGVDIAGDMLQSTLCGEYLKDLNSAPLCLPTSIEHVFGQVHAVAQRGYLFLAAAWGTATRRSLRLLTFEAVFDRYRREQVLPVNMELLQWCWQRLGARVWQREIGHGWAVQAAIGCPDGIGDKDLDECAWPLAATDHGDVSELVGAMRTVARQQGEAAVLALLRRAHFDLDVFAAACPPLHARCLMSPVADARGWAQGLHAVWAQCVLDAGSAPIHRDVALCAMRVADWQLAKQAWQRGIEALGPNAHDLAQLAWCHVRTGQLPLALPLLDQAAQVDPSDNAVRQARQLIDTRLANRHDDAWHRTMAVASSALVLEPLDILHLQAIKQQYRDPQIAAMTGLAPWPSGTAESEWFAKDFLSADRADYAVMHAGHGFVGHVGMERQGDLGFFLFWIGVDYQGGGYAVPAGKTLCDHALLHGLTYIFTSCYEDNARSYGALKRIGFRRLPVKCTTAQSPRIFFCLPAGETPGDPVEQLLRFHREKNLPVEFELETADPPAVLESA